MKPWLVAVVVVASCGGSSPRPAARAPASPPPPTPAASPAVAPSDPLAFDFETPLDAAIWGGGIGVEPTNSDAMSIDASVAHGGTHSLRLRAAPGVANGWIASRVRLPVGELRGHRLVVTAWARTELSTGSAGLWCRADGADTTLSFDNMAGRRLEGTTGWTQVVVRVAAPPSTATVLCGPLVVGVGDAWLDDLVVDREGPLGEEEYRAPVTVAGVVVDADHAPLAGMTVRASFTTDDRPVLATDESVTTGADGTFTLHLPPALWDYELTATSPTIAAGVREAVKVTALTPVAGIELRAGGPAHILSGRVLSLGGAPVAGALAGVSATQPDWAMPLFLTTTDVAGNYRIALPPGHYTPRALGPDGLATPPAGLDLTADRRLDLRFARRDELSVEAPAAVLAWLRASAVPLASVEAGHGLDDLDRFAPAIGKARIVGVGEATHGTRESSQLRHRMLEYLVARHGFSVLAIEGGYAELMALDAYVHDGTGDLDTALHGLYGVWQTEEARAMFAWMRAWNADPAHSTKLRVYGIDVQQPRRAYTAALAYLRRVDPDEGQRFEQQLASLAAGPSATAYAAVPPADRKAIRAGLAATLARFDRERARYQQATSPREWLLARQHVNVLRQHELLLDPPPGEAGYLTRDKGMAENLAWVLEVAEPGARVLLWAHNGHVSRAGYDGWMSVGERTGKRYGRAYLSIGFVWNQGGFRAGAPDGGSLHTVGPEPAGSIGATFARVGAPMFALDLRRAPRAVRPWLDAPHATRDIGATYTTDANMEAVFRLRRAYDAALFVDTTSAARDL